MILVGLNDESLAAVMLALGASMTARA